MRILRTCLTKQARILISCSIRPHNSVVLCSVPHFIFLNGPPIAHASGSSLPLHLFCLRLEPELYGDRCDSTTLSSTFYLYKTRPPHHLLPPPVIRYPIPTYRRLPSSPSSRHLRLHLHPPRFHPFVSYEAQSFLSISIPLPCQVLILCVTSPPPMVHVGD